METIINTDYYEANIDDRLGLLKLTDGIFDLITERKNADLLIEVLDKFQYDPKVKALLIYNTSDALGEKAYDDFLKKINITFNDSNQYEVPDFSDRNLRFRELYILDDLVERITLYNKPCFSFLTGEVVTPFLGAALATDIRFSTPDLVFSLAHGKYGLHPTGGIPFFLVQDLGYNKAMEILLHEKISAHEALKLGLINDIIEDENPLNVIIPRIQKMIKFRSSTLRKTKTLASYMRKDISNYFKSEGTP